MFQITHHHDVIDIETKRETEKAELLKVSYINREYATIGASLDVWSPKAAIIRHEGKIIGLAPFILQKIREQIYDRN